MQNSNVKCYFLGMLLFQEGEPFSQLIHLLFTESNGSIHYRLSVLSVTKYMDNTSPIKKLKQSVTNASCT